MSFGIKIFSESKREQFKKREYFVWISLKKLFTKEKLMIKKLSCHLWRVEAQIEIPETGFKRLDEV